MGGFEPEAFVCGGDDVGALAGKEEKTRLSPVIAATISFFREEKWDRRVDT